VIVYLHGGGWVLGELDDFDAMARTLAVRSGSTVLLPEYRLAPEHVFPAGLDDVCDALLWAVGAGDEVAGGLAPLAVAGDSAGANLATVAAALLRGRLAPVLQVLIYPVTDCDFQTSSYREFGQGLPFLTGADMRWFFDHYSKGELHRDARISPLRAADLSDMPPAIIVTAEYDVLRDEGEAYARRLLDAAVPVALRRAEGLPHDFVRMHNLVDAADETLSHIASDIALRFAAVHSPAANATSRD
jgi:acetyl esterase